MMKVAVQINLILFHFKENFDHEAECEWGVNVRRALTFLHLNRFWATPFIVHTPTLHYNTLHRIVSLLYITLRHCFMLYYLDDSSNCANIILSCLRSIFLHFGNSPHCPYIPLQPPL